MARSDVQIEQGQKYLKIWQQYTSRPMAAHHLSFAQAIEAEVRKQDDALIRQLVEALDATHGWWGDGEWYGPKTPHWHELTSVARSSARARLNN